MRTSSPPSSRPSTGWRRRSSVGLLLVLIGALGGCKGPPEGQSWAAGARGEKKQALQVATVKLEPARIERYYRSSGTLQPKRQADVVPTQLGIIDRLMAEEGDTVKEGQVLARLDGRQFALQAAAADVQLENLERELERLESVAQGAISAEEIDKQRYAVEEARASAKLSRFQAKQSVVRAPFTGTVLERHVDIGNLATTATPLFTVADVQRLELELYLPERDALTVDPDAEVELELIEGTRFSAKVVRRAPRVDDLTGTVAFTVGVDDPPDKALPGAFVRAEILVDARDQAPSLPPSAIFEVEGEPHVFVIVDGKAERRAVKLGLQGIDRVEVVEGVKPDDVVVRDGNAGVTEGMPLAPANDAGDSESPAKTDKDAS